MKKLFIIAQGMSYEDRTQHLINALKANKNVIDIKDQMSDDEYKTLEEVLNKDIPGEFKFALLDEMFGMIQEENPDCQTIITNADNPRLPMIAEKYYGFKTVRVFLNDADVAGDLIEKIINSYPFKIENYVLLYGEDYKKMAEELLSAKE